MSTEPRRQRRQCVNFCRFVRWIGCDVIDIDRDRVIWLDEDSCSTSARSQCCGHWQTAYERIAFDGGSGGIDRRANLHSVRPSRILYGRNLPTVNMALEKSLETHAGKPVGAIVRTAEKMQAVLDANPFQNAEPGTVGVLFLDTSLSSRTIDAATGQADEEIVTREPRGLYSFSVWDG